MTRIVLRPLLRKHEVELDKKYVCNLTGGGDSALTLWIEKLISASRNR